MRALQLTAALCLGAAAFTAAFTAQAADPEAVRKKAEPCTSCHGATGNSPSPDVPSLAGQPKQFITTQLVMFREGRRANPIMAALTANMSNADINEIGGWFAAQTAAPATAPLPDAQMVAGRQRAEQLNCTQCHGATLKGQQHIPRLAGQHAVYLKAQLLGFKAQTRFDMDGNMTSAAQALTAADIDLLSGYLAALQ